MASFYSKPADYGTYTQPINLELVNFVLGSKQQKYDYNLAKLDYKVQEQLGKIDLERPQDKEYFVNKAQEVINSMGDMSKLDLSQSGVIRQIDGRIDSIIDDKVLNDVVSTKNYRNFQQTVAQKQKDNPELYNNTNVAFAMDAYGVNSWLKGESDSVGTVSYEDYVDVNLELKDISENLDKYAEVVKTTAPDGRGYFITKEGKRMSAEQVRNVAESVLSDKAKRQMEINGWANYDAGVKAPEEVAQTFKEFSGNYLNNIDNRINDLKLKYKNLEGSNSSQAQEYKDAYDNLVKQRESLQSTFDQWTTPGKENRKSMTTFMEKERVLGNFGQTFAFDNVGTEYSSDSTALQLEKMRLDSIKEKLKADKDMDEAFPGRNIVYQDELSQVDRLSDVENDIKSYSDAFKGATNNAFSNLDSDVQSDIDSTFDPNSGMDIEEHRYKKMEELLLENNGIVSLETLMPAFINKQNYEASQQLYTDAESKAIEILEERGLEQVFEGGLREFTASVLGTTLKEALEKNNIKTKADLDKPENAAIKNEILKRHYGGVIASTVPEGVSKVGMPNVIGNVGMKLISSLAGTSGGVMYNRLRDLISKELISNKIKVTDEAIQKEMQKYVAPGNFIGSFLVPSVGGNLNFDEGDLDSELAKQLNESTKQGRGVAVQIPGDSDVAQQLAQTANNAVAALGESASFKIGKENSIVLINEDADSVTLMGQVTVKGGVANKAVRILKANLPESVLSQVELNPQRSVVTSENFKEIKEVKVRYKDVEDAAGLMDYADTFFNGNMDAAIMEVSKDGLIDGLRSNFYDVMGTKMNPTPVGIAVTNLIESGEAEVNLVKKKGKVYQEIVIRGRKNEPIVLETSMRPVADEDLSEAIKRTKFLPQGYLNRALYNRLAQYLSDPENPPAFIEKILEYYGQQ